MGLLAATVIGLSAPAAAAAADRYAAPVGTGPEPCRASNPCSLEAAVGINSNYEDRILLAAGEYVTGELSIFKDLTVRPEDGPVTISSNGANGVFLQNDSRLADLTIVHSGTNVGLLMFGGRADRVTVTTSGNSACGPYDAVIRDSACINNGLAAAVTMATGGTVTQQSKLVNVTAFADAGPGIAIYTNGGADNTLVAENVIAKSASGTDLTAEADATSSSSIELAHSAYEDVASSGAGSTSITPPGTGSNITDEPVLADPLGGDVHQLLGSPTIDGGEVVADLGSSDIDGDERIGGESPDIGADEADAKAPRTRFTKKPKKVVATGARKASLRFRFTANESSTFECKLDRRPFEPCESPVQVRLGPGKHRFQVRATDAFLNADRSPATARFRIKRR